MTQPIKDILLGLLLLIVMGILAMFALSGCGKGTLLEYAPSRSYLARLSNAQKIELAEQNDVQLSNLKGDLRQDFSKNITESAAANRNVSLAILGLVGVTFWSLRRQIRNGKK